VFDNCSTDRTAELSARAGAQVIRSPRPGKGHVVRHMFCQVEAEHYLLVDGDDTYPAAASPLLIDALRDAQRDGIGMTVAARHRPTPGAFRRFHRFGNFAISRLISLLFKVEITDALSGQRALRRELVKGAPLRASGFDIETELTLRALSQRLGILEIPIAYGPRPAGSHSKLRTISDGALILRAILRGVRRQRP
jgi:glycosyltransferase involved in cell wall biosynthesis